MAKTLFTSFYTTTELQRKIMRFVDYWVHTEKTPISQKAIVEELERRRENRKTILYAIDGLLKQGYLRKAISISSGNDGKGSEKTRYVQLRSL